MQLEDRTLFSATPMAAEVLVNTDTTGAQQTHVEAQQSVASDASGNFVVAWTSNGQDGSGNGVYAQRFDSAGNKVGGEIQVNSTTANDQLHASVAVDASGDFIVAWESLLQDGTGYGIFAQRFDASGNAVGGELQVNTTTFSDQRNPSAAMDAAGNLVVTWSSFGQDGSGYGIYGQRYDASGAAQGSEFQIHTAAAGDQDYSSVAFAGTGDFIVTWTGQDADGTGIYAQRFNSSGVAQESEFLVNTTTIDAQIYSSIAADSAGNFIIAWASNLQDGGGHGIYAQRFDSSGVAQGSEFQVNVTAAGDQSAPRVAMAANGAFVVSWTSTGQDAAGTDGVYFRQYDSAGVVQTNETLANSTTSGNQRFSSVAMQSNDSFVVVWSGNGSGDANGVFAQLYVDGTNLAPVNTVPGSQSTAEDTGLIFSAGNGNQISVADADAPSNPLRVTLTGSNGTITLASLTGITFSAGDGTDDLTMTFTGTAADINTALDGFTFTPGTNFVGAAGVAITTNDLGYSGTGGAKSDTDNVAITVSAVNDVDAYSGSLPVSLNVGGGTGTLSLASMTGLSFITGDGTADASMQFTETLASINAALDSLISSASSLSVPTASGDSGVYEASADTSAVADASAAANEIAATVRHELVIVDANIEDVDRLVADVQANADASRRFAVVRVNFQGDGVKQISDLLAAYDDLSAIHLLSHASDGALRLGDVQLTNANFDDYSAQIAQWRGSLTADADLLFYGCELAAGEQGQALLTRFEQTTGADVAASTDNTGNALFGGNWNLEFNDGPIETTVAFSAAAQREWVNLLNVAVDTTSTGSTTNQISVTVSHTTSGSNRLMLVSVVTDPHGESVSSITYNGVSLTLVGSQAMPTGGGEHSRVEIWSLVAPDTGTHDVVVTMTGTGHNGVIVGAMTFTGVDQTTPVANFASDFGNSASASVTVTSQTNDLVFATVHSHNGSSVSPGVGQTEYWDLSADQSNGGGTIAAGAVSVSNTWTVNSNDWTAAGVSIQSAVPNTAPVLNTAATPVLANISEEVGAPSGVVGTLVSSLVDFDSPSGQLDNVVDPDSGAQLGIAITNVDTTNGSWWYSTDNGSNWNALGAVSDGNSRLLSADANTRIYFQPGANYNGTVSNAVTFRAWDETAGTNGSTADTTTNGGSTAFSSATDTAAITVNAVNDAPVLDNTGTMTLTTITEDDTANSGDAVFTIIASAGGDRITDVDASPFEGIAVTGLNSGNGTWQYNTGAGWVSVGAVSNVSALLLRDTDRLRFVPDGLNATTADVTFRAWDQSSGAAGTKVDVSTNGGTTAFSTATESAAITVTAVNDAPMNAVPGPQSVNEDTTLVFSAGNGNPISISDVDASTNPVQVTLTATNGLITLNGLSGLSFVTGGGTADATMTFTGTIANINTALNGLSFTPTANFNGAAQLQITTNDQGNSGTGGALSDTDTIAITVNAVNDAPVNTVPGPQSTNEDTTLVFSSGNGSQISIADIDAGGGTMQVTLTATNGAITLSGVSGLSFTIGDGTADGVMTFSGTIANINTALNGLSFAPTANFSGAASLQIITNDQGNTGSGGPSSDTDSVAITVNAVNDAPVNSVPVVQSTNEDTALIFSSGNGNQISIADIDAGGGTMQVTLTATNGAITLSGVSGLSFVTGTGSGDATMTFTGSIANINSALNGLSFAPAANFNGAAQLQIVTNDQGNTGSGGAQSDTDTVAITVNAVNDAPVLTLPAPSTTPFRTPVTFTGSQLNISDVDAGSGLLQLTITAHNGTVSFSQTTGLNFLTGTGSNDALIVVQGTLSDLNAALNGSAFTPTTTFRGSTTIDFAVNDLGNNGSGGAQQATGQAAVDVAPAAQRITLEAPSAIAADAYIATLSSSTGTAIRLVDVYAENPTLTVTVSTSTGTITLSGTSGLTFIAGSNASSSMTLLGTMANVNAALEGARINFEESAATLSITASDPPRDGTGSQTVSASIGITQPIVFPSPTPLVTVEVPIDSVPPTVTLIVEAPVINVASVVVVAPPAIPVALHPLAGPLTAGQKIFAAEAIPLQLHDVEPTFSDEMQWQFGTLEQLNSKALKRLAPKSDTAPARYAGLDALLPWSKISVTTKQSPDEAFDEVLIAGTAGVTATLSVGYVLWSLRAASLISTFLASMPAWQAFDPLPVLDFENRRRGDGLPDLDDIADDALFEKTNTAS